MKQDRQASRATKNWFGVNTINGERVISSTNGVRITGHSYAKMNHNLNHTPYKIVTQNRLKP